MKGKLEFYPVRSRAGNAGHGNTYKQRFNGRKLYVVCGEEPIVLFD